MDLKNIGVWAPRAALCWQGPPWVAFRSMECARSLRSAAWALQNPGDRWSSVWRRCRPTRRSQCSGPTLYWHRRCAVSRTAGDSRGRIVGMPARAPRCQQWRHAGSNPVYCPQPAVGSRVARSPERGW